MKAGDIYPTIHGDTVTVVKYEGSMRVTIEFNDNYKHRQVFQSDRVRKGGMKNPYKPSVYGVGFLGVGKYKAQINGKMTKHYTIWKAMMSRCYHEKSHKYRPTYVGCTVCPDWHNYQNFAIWYDNRVVQGVDLDLDKDLLVVGNKIYSPETCVLVPTKINNLIKGGQNRSSNLPVGVSVDKDTGRFKSAMKIDGVERYFGMYACPIEAGDVYAENKEEAVKERALEYKGLIERRAFDALRNFSIKERGLHKNG